MRLEPCLRKAKVHIHETDQRAWIEGSKLRITSGEIPEAWMLTQDGDAAAVGPIVEGRQERTQSDLGIKIAKLMQGTDMA